MRCKLPMSILCCTSRTQRSITWLRSELCRFMGVTRENVSRFLTSSPQRLLSLAIRSSELAHFFGPWRRGEVVLDPASAARVGEDSGERVVDLVRHHGGHLADGRHLLDCSMCSCACLSSRVFSSTRSSRVCAQAVISSCASCSRRSCELNDCARSPISSLE